MRASPTTTPLARTSWLLPALLIVTCLAAVASLGIGARQIPIGGIIDALRGTADAATTSVVLEQRLPRTLIGLCVGAALGMAGAVMQALTRNPLADPGILGINAGAAFAVVVSAVLFGATALSSYMWAAFLGAGFAAVGVYLLGGIGGGGAATPVRLTLAGVAVTAALTALTQVLVLADPVVFDEFRTWVNGSLQNRWLSHWFPVAPFFVIGALGAVLATPGLDALALGSQVGKALGVPLGWIRGIAITSVTLLAGASTALVGPLAFVGLAAPVAARILVGDDLRRALPVVTVLGAVLVVSADVLARIAVEAEAPVGAVVTVAGAPLFVALVRARRIPRL